MKIIRSIVSIFLALLVLMASSSFYLSAHSCGGRVKEVAFLEKADGCGHQKLPPCHRQLVKSCCEDEVIAHQSQDLKTESKLFAFPFLFSFEVALTAFPLAEIIPSFTITPSKYVKYDTPLRSIDRTVTHQVFLI